VDRSAQFGHAVARDRRDRNRLRVRCDRSDEGLVDEFACEGELFGIDRIGFRQHDDRLLDAQVLKYGEMLDRLRLRPLVCRDNEQQEFHTRGTREHVV